MQVGDNSLIQSALSRAEVVASGTVSVLDYCFWVSIGFNLDQRLEWLPEIGQGVQV
jgi:hypothetical protein